MKTLWSAVLGLALSIATPAFADTNLVFAFWGDPPEVPPFQKIAADYMAKHPDVHIELQNAPWSGYFTKLDAELAAGGGPDVFFITNVPSYAARNTLEDLGPWIAKTNFPIDQYVKDSLRIHSLNGKLYSIPRDTATNVLYYNKDDFDKAGIKYPDGTWKWADLQAAAKKLTVTSGGRVTRYGLVLESNEWPMFVYQNGGSVFDDPVQPTTFTLGDDKGAAAIQWVADMINKDKSVPNFQESDQMGGTASMFTADQASMSITNASRLGSYANATFKWAVAPVPAGPDGIKANEAGGAGFAMNANSKIKDAAWAFMQYLCGPDGQIAFTSSGGSPAVPAMIGNADVKASFKAPFADVFLSESENGKVFPQFPKYVDITNKLIQPALDKVWNGESTAADALGGIKDQVNAALKAQ
ncbi:MAG TPA: sugar ABC transporter substrate-binding protein [Devosia sp.]|jgi:multiple sugar transport system substrate-binding protein|nr:sugar ABC transporter substrate-binding protein [Devosia sp.]